MEIFFHLFCCYILCIEVGNINAGTLKRKFTRVFWNTTSQCTYFLYFSSSHLQSTTPHQTPSPSTPYRHIPLHTYSPAPKGVVKYDTLPLFPKKNYPCPTISCISLDKSPPFLYNIQTYVLFLLGQLPGSRPERRRSPPQNRPAPGKNSKGVVKRDSLCHKEGFPIAGDSGNKG